MTTGEQSHNIPSTRAEEEGKDERVVPTQLIGQSGVDLAAILYKPPTRSAIAENSLRVAGYVNNERAGF